MKFEEQEGELIFIFLAILVEKLDRQDKPKPEGMCLVDFVIEETDKIFLIEIKDPCRRKAPESNKKAFLKQLKQKTLINKSLVPKARDSYTYLHLMERDNKPFFFVVVLGLDHLKFDEALLLTFQDRLRERIRKEAAEPWKRKYIKDCIVVTTENWPKYFPEYGIAREWKSDGQ